MPDPIPGEDEERNERGQPQYASQLEHKLKAVVKEIRPEHSGIAQPGQRQQHENQQQKNHAPKEPFLPFGPIDLLADSLTIPARLAADQGLQKLDLFLAFAHAHSELALFPAQPAIRFCANPA